MSEKTNKNVPELRFKGFSDAWVQRNLAELSNRFSYGLNASAKEYDGVHGYLRITDIDEESHLFMPDGLTSPDVPEDQLKDYQMDEQSIVYARTGASTGKTYIYRDSDGELYYAGFLIRQKVNDENSAKFVYQNTLTKSWERYVQVMSQRSGQPGINAQEVGQFELAVPEKAEQDKIAALFERMDNLIAANQRKLDSLKMQKSAYLARIFNQSLRFSGFHESWKLNKFSDGMFEYTDRVTIQDENDYPQLSISNKGRLSIRGVTNGRKIGRKRQAKINLVEHPNTLVFTRQGVQNGSIGFASDEVDGAIVTENMPTIDVDTTVWDLNYLSAFFNTSQYYKNALLDNIDGGSAQIAIHEDKWIESTVYAPNILEQNKIGKMFSILDELIITNQKKIELLKNKKSAYLQKMFV